MLGEKDAQEESEPIGPKGQCPCDDPSQSFTLYSDGHGYCFAGGCPHPYWTPQRLQEAGWEVDPDLLISGPPDYERPQARPRVSEDIVEAINAAQVKAITAWKISLETCERWDYRVRLDRKGEGEHLAVYRDESGAVVDVKVRRIGRNYERKEFYWLSGKAPKGLIYGAHRLGNGGKQITVAMGEKDVLTVDQLWGGKFPVVGPSNGEGAIKRDFAPYLDRLSKYDKVVIVQDEDKAGRERAVELAQMLPPGKAFITRLPRKDATETALKDGVPVLTSAIHNAAQYRPDGIVDADDIDGELLNPTEWGLSLPYDWLYKWTYGMRPGEVWMLGAGTGIGKSDFWAETMAHLIKPQEDGGEYVPIAVFNYEAGAIQTLKLVLGKLWSKRFNIPDPEDGSPNLYWTPEDMIAAREYRRAKCAKLFINDHKGAVDWASVKERIRFLVHEGGCRVAFVDPVAALVAQEDDDRKALDRLFAEGKSLAEELGITLVFNSHLTRPSEGKSHEEGGRVTLKHFRGSGAIVMWASFVFGLERNQQAEDEEERADTTFRVLKDRFTGDSTGKTRTIVYNVLSGRLEDKVLQMVAIEPHEPVEPPPL